MHSYSCIVRHIAVSLLFSGTSVVFAEDIRIGGTGAALGTMTQLAAAFQKVRPEHSIRILPSLGTSGGLKALQAGALDIAVSARDVSAEERGTGLSAIRYGTTAFVFVSHPKVPVQTLTRESVAALYSGKQPNWSNGQPVRLILRPKGDSDTKQLSKLSPEIEAAVAAAHDKSGMVLAITDSDAADQLDRTPGGLGTSTLALVLSENRHVNILPLEGVTPTIETLTNGSYAHTKDLYAVTTAAAPNGARQFLQFMRSPQGTDILKKTGHKVPASN